MHHQKRTTIDRSAMTLDVDQAVPLLSLGGLLAAAGVVIGLIMAFIDFANTEHIGGALSAIRFAIEAAVKAAGI